MSPSLLRVGLAGTAGAVAMATLLSAAATPARSEQQPVSPSTNTQSALSAVRPNFAQMLRDQAETDRRWRAASAGHMRMEKITYRSSLGDLDVPAFVFQPLETRGVRQHPALVWVHENIRGHMYEHYIPYVRDATSRGFIVIAPEYRGSIGYGRQLYDAIDYGGAEVDDVVTTAGVLATRYPAVDPARIGILGWSHGGLITLLSIFRNPTTFRAAAAIVPVANLFHRLARRGIDRQRIAMDPHNRFGGSPAERPEVYRARSPLFHVDQLRIPLLLHVADNDEDVDIGEVMPLVDALKGRKAALVDVKIYRNPRGGHLFDRLVTPATWQPENTVDQRDSWGRLWGFLDNNLRPPYN